MAESRQFYSIPEAAALMGVSRIAIFKRVKKGQLAAIRVGRNWAIPAQAIAEPGTAKPPRAAAAPARAQAQPAGGEPAPETDPLDEMGWD